MKRFMHLALVLAVLSGSVALSGNPLPRGTFVGVGTWTSADGQKGEYKSEVTITADAITMTQESTGERSWKGSHTMGLRKRPDGQFDLLDGKGATLGLLSCGDDECSYSISQDGAQVKSTMRLVGKVLHHSGTKTYGKYQIEWSEELHLR